MICLYQQEGLEFSGLVSEVLKRLYNLSTIRAAEFKIPKETFNPLRNQYDASQIIVHLNEHYDKQCDKHLLLVDIDLYTPRFNFIFGLAEPHKGAAIVSLYRLTGNDLIKQRLAKEVVHEVGHLLGLSHCSIATCVMHFSNTIDDTDKKNINLCDKCRRKIEGL